VKKTKFLFDLPVTKDWMFWVFIVISISGIFSALQNVANSGGLSTSPGGVSSGLIDGAFRVFTAWVWIVPIYFIRKFIRKRKNTQN